MWKRGAKSVSQLVGRSVGWSVCIGMGARAEEMARTYADGLEHRGQPGEVCDAVAERVDGGLEEGDGGA